MAGWKFEIVVPATAVEAFANAVESFCPTVAFFEIPGKPFWRIEGYAPNMPSRVDTAAAMAIAAARAGVAEPVFNCSPLPETDWVADNQASFQPLTAGRYFIRPSHHAGAPPYGAIAITLDAGAAFGTGGHATTKSCLFALDWLAKRRRFTRPLDLGSGSGILALAMAATWRRPVTATDIDPQSVMVARENAAINGLAAWTRMHCGDGLSGRQIRVAGPYDLVAANILAKPLIKMSRPLCRRLAPGGMIVLSGLLAHQEIAVRNAYRRQGLALHRRFVLEGWHTLIVGRRQPG